MEKEERNEEQPAGLKVVSKGIFHAGVFNVCSDVSENEECLDFDGANIS